MAAIADLNTDGHTDLVISHARKNILSILLKSGTGAFTLQQGPPISLQAPASEVVAMDVDRDKTVDLVATLVDMTAPFASKIVVLSRRWARRIPSAPGSLFPAGTAAYRLAVGDVNEDGKVDIASSSFESDAVTLLLGR